MRQEDPLSPLLFGLAEDHLNHLLTSLVILYADSVMLFCKSSFHNIRCIFDTFAKYGELFGQFIN